MITWLENPKKFEYLRVSKVLSAHPSYKGISNKHGEKLVGYTSPIKISPHLWEKTIYWLKAYDRCMPKEKECYGKEPINYKYKPSESKTIAEILKKEREYGKTID